MAIFVGVPFMLLFWAVRAVVLIVGVEDYDYLGDFAKPTRHLLVILGASFLPSVVFVIISFGSLSLTRRIP